MGEYHKIGSVLIWIGAPLLAVGIVFGMHRVLKGQCALDGNLPVQPFGFVQSGIVRLQDVRVENPAVKAEFCESLRKGRVSAKGGLFLHLRNIAAKYNLLRLEE